MDKDLMREFAETPYWLQLNDYLESTKEGIKLKLVKQQPNDVSGIAFLQGRYDMLSTLQGLINKFKEE